MRPVELPIRATRLPSVWGGLPVLVCLLLASACGGGGGAPPTPGPVFFFAGTTPLAGAFGVSLTPTVLVTFNKDVDAATVDQGALQVTSAAGVVMAGTVSLVSSRADTLRWIPIHNLDPGAQHTVTLGAALRSVDGDAVGGPGTFSFVTTPGTGGDGLPTADQLRPALNPLRVGRQEHEATLLDDGRVLITGGFTLGASSTDRAEVFLTALEQFVELDKRMVRARAGHTATKLQDGRVLLAGGWFLIAPGQSATTATAEIFDPATNTFTATGSMTTQRADHAAALLPDGRVLITGGGRLVGTFLEDLATAEVFDPTTGIFTALSQEMTHTRATHGMVDDGLGLIVLGGGSDTDRRHDGYRIATGLFEDLGAGASDQGRFGPAMASFASGAVVIAGGDLLGTVMVVTTAGDVMNTGSGLNRPRSYAQAVRIKPDQILVTGGIDFSRGGFIEASCDVLVEGGFGGSNTFASAVRFTTGMVHHTATVLPSGDVLFCGGLNEDGSQPNKTAAFLFDVR